MKTLKINNYIEYDGSTYSINEISDMCNSSVDFVHDVFNSIYVYHPQTGSFIAREGDYVLLMCDGSCEPVTHRKFEELNDV